MSSHFTHSAVGLQNLGLNILATLRHQGEGGRREREGGGGRQVGGEEALGQLFQAVVTHCGSPLSSSLLWTFSLGERHQCPVSVCVCVCVKLVCEVGV